MDVVDDSDAVEDQGEGHEYHRRHEEVQCVLGLRDAAVAPGEADGEHAANFARVVSAAERKKSVTCAMKTLMGNVLYRGNALLTR